MPGEWWTGCGVNVDLMWTGSEEKTGLFDEKQPRFIIP